MPVPETLSQKRRRAVNKSWANTTDRTARTANARKAADARFEAQVDPDGVMTPGERRKAASEARTAFYKAIAVKSVAARKAKREVETR